MTEKKVKVAIFDADGRCKIEKHPLSTNGKQININSGGTEHFMPHFDRNCILQIPRLKKFLFFGERSFEPVYFVANKAKKCVNFSIPEVYGPSPEELKNAVGALIATKIGTAGITIPWYISVLLGVLLLLQLWALSTMGAF